MRTISATAAAARAARTQADFVRVLVKDAGGTWRDLTSYGGTNVLRTVNWSEMVSDPHRNADVVLAREFFKVSFSPWISASPINTGFDPAASPVPLLQQNREFRIDAAVVPMDRQPASGDWFTVFHGRIDSIDPGGGGLKFGGRDLAGRLADQQIKKEYVYSFASDGGVSVPLRPWEAGMVVALNEYVLPASRGDDDPGQGKFYKCTTAGTSANSEPAWPGAGTVADGTVVWTYVGVPSSVGRPVEQTIQAILNTSKSASDSTVTLHVPVSPGWAIKEFLQARDHTLPAVKALALQIGWDVRMKWRAATAQFELTLFEPERTKTTADATFTASEYLPPKRFETNIDSIRNSWTIKYSDAADLWPDGSAKRKEINVSDPTSIANNGELWSEINEGDASNIDTGTEATKMVNSALADTKEPTAEMAVELVGGFPWCEVGDLYEFGADQLTFDTAQKMAVSQWAQSFTGGKLRTTLEVSGKPSLGAGRWLAVATDRPARSNRPAPLVHFNGPTTQTPTLRSEPGGFTLALASQHDKARLPEDEAEIHLYEAPSTALSSATLKAMIKGQGTKSFADLVPGKTYRGVIVPRWYSKGRLIRGQPSAEFTQVAGRAGAGHLDSLIMTKGPLNGKFQTALDSLTSSPPDHWSITAGEWGSAKDVYYSSDTTNGRHIAFRQTAVIGKLRSSAWALPRGVTLAQLTASVRPRGKVSAGRRLLFEFEFFAEETLTTSMGTQTGSAAYTLTTETWTEFSEWITVPPGSNFVRLNVYKEAASSDFGWDLGGVYFEPAPITPLVQEDWTAVTFQNSFSDFNTAGWTACAYMKDSMGFVHLRGLAKRATAALLTAVFTLPDGYRPTKEINFSGQGREGFCRISISAAGVLVVSTATDANWFQYFSIEGFTFDTR